MQAAWERQRWARRQIGKRRSWLALDWASMAAQTCETGYDLVLVDEPWDLERDAVSLLDAAAQRLHRDGVLVMALAQQTTVRRWAEPSPRLGFSALLLRTLLADRFEQVELFHQSSDHDWAVCDGAAPDAPIVVGLARGPKVAAPAVDVSIVIPVFNRHELTAACLRALAAVAPEAGLRCETIVIDNASHDRTGWVLHAAAQDARLGLRVVHNAENLGFATACNQGAVIARGATLVFLNNDTEPRPGWLRPLVDELQTHTDTGVVGARLLYPDGTLQHAGVAVGRSGIPYHLHAGLPGDDRRALERRAFPVVTGACMAVRRQEFLQRGAFDEGYRNGSEDIDLCLRYRRAGRECIYRPDSVTVHHESQSAGRLDHRDRNIERLLDRWRDDLIQDDFALRDRLDERRRAARPLRLALKIGVPNRTIQNWGDIYFAEGLARALVQAGHRCEIHYLNEWGRDDRDIDVVIHLKGLTRYEPKPWNLNLLWMINHPSLHEDAELERYDAVLVASAQHARTLKARLTVPVHEFLQATDPQQFAPRPQVAKRWDLVFVGNNGGTDRAAIRPIIADLLPTPHQLAVWGSGWEGLLPPGVWQGKFVPAEQLADLYAASWIVLNDHQAEMRQFGFVNNRTFDAVACGSIVVCDDVIGLDQLLPLARYRTRDELAALIDRLLADRQAETARAGALIPDVARRFSFASRVVQLEAIVAAATDRPRPFPAVITEEAPVVTVLLATKDRREFLPQTLASIRAQSYPRWQLLLVNDGGAPIDDLVESSRDPRIELIDLPRNQGKAHALNVAASRAHGAFFAHQDDDDIWHADHLERLLLPLLHLPSVRFAFSAAVDVHLARGAEQEWVQVRRQLVYDRHCAPDDLLFYNQIQGITVVHDRELFTQAGGYDPRLAVLLDWDLWRRMAAFTRPYYIGRVTAERTLRGPEAGATGHLTRLIDRDPIAYYLNRLRILRKPLAFPDDSPIHTQLRTLRRLARAETAILIGEHRLVAGQIDKAARSFERAARWQPSHAGGWRGWGLCLLKQGHLPAALRALLQALQIGPTQPSDYLYAAVAALSLGDGALVLELLRVGEKAHPETVATQAQIYADYRRKAEALIAARRETAPAGA